MWSRKPSLSFALHADFHQRPTAFVPSFAFGFGKLSIRLLVAYDHVLGRLADEVIEATEGLTTSVKSNVIAKTAESVSEKLRHGVSVADFTEDELRVMIIAMRRMQVPADRQEEIEETISPVITGEEIVEDAVVLH